MNNDVFSIRLKELRTSLNLTQKAFAESISISTVTISSYENGVKSPSVETVKKICEKYNTSLDWLCGLSDEKRTNQTPETYADLIKLLVTISEIHELNIEIGSCLPLELEGNPNVSSLHELGCIKFDDSILKSFLSQWAEMHSLRKQGTIKWELYHLWLEDKIKSFVDCPITTFNQITDSF